MIFIEFYSWAAFDDDQTIFYKLPPRALMNIRSMIKYDELISLSIIDFIDLTFVALQQLYFLSKIRSTSRFCYKILPEVFERIAG